MRVTGGKVKEGDKGTFKIYKILHVPFSFSSVSYRPRAEVPGKFSALPTRASAMYAPELKGNSDEIKLVIGD